MCREHRLAPTPSQTLPKGLCPPPVPTLNSKPTSKQPALTSTPQVTPPVPGVLQVPKRIMMEDHQPPPPRQVPRATFILPRTRSL